MRFFVRSIALAVAMQFAGPGELSAGVAGTPHDMTRVTGDLFRGSCAYCHVPHKAQGERLWVSAPFGPVTGWGSRPIAQLCYTCHESTGNYGASNAVPTAFSPESHGYQTSLAPLNPDGSVPLLEQLPYVATGLMDCTTCHDPHAVTPPFLRVDGIDKLCKGCHARENAGLVGTQNTHGQPDALYSLHPTDIDYEDLPGNGTTNLHPLPDIFQVPTASGSWKLGGHRAGWQSGTGKIGCQTCHPIHGGWNYLLGVLPGPPASSLTPVENTGTPSAALCQSCHFGGDAGESVGVGGDHPMNRNDGAPVVVYPTGWPSGPLREVTCSSCHDVHGGMPGSSLLRQGGNGVDGWCFSCHGVLALIPAYHHSSRHNDDPAIFTSVLTCGDCHGSGAGWTAHNGFDSFKVVSGASSSALCEICHVPENPLLLDAARYQSATGLSITFSGATQPALHGPVPGTGSHVINEPDDDSIANCQIKMTPWEKSGGTSRYGATLEVICESCHAVLKNAGVLLGTGVDAQLAGGWKTNLLLEPYEDNSPGTGIEKPDFIAGPTQSALCRGCHYAVREGIPPSFVHNPSAHTVVNYSYPAALAPYGRATNIVLTTPIDSTGPLCPEVSSADQGAAPSGLGAAPGAFSYPAANVVDCDSCHRPHGAHNAAADDGKRRLLEYTSPGAHGTTPCAECHDTGTQCGYKPLAQ